MYVPVYAHSCAKRMQKGKQKHARALESADGMSASSDGWCIESMSYGGVEVALSCQGGALCLALVQPHPASLGGRGTTLVCAHARSQNSP